MLPRKKSSIATYLLHQLEESYHTNNFDVGSAIDYLVEALPKERLPEFVKQMGGRYVTDTEGQPIFLLGSKNMRLQADKPFQEGYGLLHIRQHLINLIKEGDWQDKYLPYTREDMQSFTERKRNSIINQIKTSFIYSNPEIDDFTYLGFNIGAYLYSHSLQMGEKMSGRAYFLDSCIFCESTEDPFDLWKYRYTVAGETVAVASCKKCKQLATKYFFIDKKFPRFWEFVTKKKRIEYDNYIRNIKRGYYRDVRD